MTFDLDKLDTAEATKLAALVRALNLTGHNPATSGNYSLRSHSLPGFALVSESGVDKSSFTERHFLPVNFESGELHPAAKGRRSSAETAIHLCLYRATPANCVLHSHLLEALLFADLHPAQPKLTVRGLELLKGFKGVTTHETTISIPCFENTQDIDRLAAEIAPAILPGSDRFFGLILRGHGLYVWGDSVDDAKRHLEVFEYVFKYYLARRRHGL
jgi:methylthioribulose-1-phosphate dehydratase